MTKLTDEELAELAKQLEISTPAWTNAFARSKLFAHIAALQSELDDQRWRYVEDGELPGPLTEVHWTRTDGSLTTGWVSPGYARVFDQAMGRGCYISEMRAWRPIPREAPERKKEADPCPG